MIDVAPPTVYVASGIQTHPTLVIRELSLKYIAALTAVDVVLVSLFFLLLGVAFAVLVFYHKLILFNVLICCNASSFFFGVNEF